MKETFGQRLARLRKAKGLTQEDIANRISISPQAVSKWENDLSTPDIYVLASLADILGVSVDELLGREPTEENKNETSNEETQEEAKKEESETVESEVVDDEDRVGKEYVNFGPNGIHVVNEKESVHIDGSGIHVHSNEDDVDIDSEHMRKYHYSKPSIWEIISNGVIWGLALIGFILMGVLWTDQNIGWKVGWTLFLGAIIISSTIEAIRKKRFCVFAYPIAVVGTYCLLGILGDHFGFAGWSFYWFLFITIPAFYMIFGPIDRLIHRNDVVVEIND